METTLKELELLSPFLLYQYSVNGVLTTKDRTCRLFKIKFIILSWILLVYSVIINFVFYINLSLVVELLVFFH